MDAFMYITGNIAQKPRYMPFLFRSGACPLATVLSQLLH